MSDTITATNGAGWRDPAGWREAAILLLAAAAFRFATLGDPALNIDETFYFMVGHAMHDGAVPYIDIWDRKPFGLFALYYLFAAISDHVLAYQIPALLAAAATAFVLAKMARLWLTGWGPTLGGIAYLAMLHPLDGFGGQSPVFYNLPIAGAALLIIGGWYDFERAHFVRRYLAAMLLCALALTIKQTTMFEAIFFGLAGLFRLYRDDMPAFDLAKIGAVAIAIGLAPTAAIAIWYAAHGWIDEWWHAMFTSSLLRQPLGLATQMHNFYAMFRLILVFLGCAIFGLVFHRNAPGFARYRRLVIGWLAAAFLGFVVVANSYNHYLLPLLVPLTPVAAIAFGRRLVGPILFGMTLIVSAILGTIFDYDHHRENRASYRAAEAAMRAHMEEGRLLVFFGNPLFYATTGAHPLSPLAFPNHLNDPLERDVSHLATDRELRRILAARPEAILIRRTLGDPVDRDIRALLEDHIRENCRNAWQGPLYEPRGRNRVHIVYACE